MKLKYKVTLLCIDDKTPIFLLLKIGVFLNFNIYNSIILAGIVQGVFFGAVVLLSKKYNHKSVYFLVTLVLLFSLNNFQYYLVDIGLFDYDNFYRNYYFPWAEFTPALLYFYVVSFLFPEENISRKAKWLLLLFGVHFLVSVSYKILVRVKQKTEYIDQLAYNFRYYSAYYAELVTGLFSICVLVILFFKIRNHQNTYTEYQQNYIKLELNWLRITLFLLLALTILNLTLVVTDMQFFGDISYYPVWILLTLIIYWLGHIGVYKYGILEQRKQIRKKQIQNSKSSKKGKTKHIIIERLKEFLENEKCFLDASLTLEKTAKALELSQGHLSKIINTELGISFKDYINALRIEEAKIYLKDSEFSNYTLVAIGLEAGFNSKSAFNSSFKKITGETPSQFKQRHIN